MAGRRGLRVVLLALLFFVFLIGLGACTRYETIEVEKPPRSGIKEGIERVGLTSFGDSSSSKLGDELLFKVSDLLFAKSPYTIVQTDMRSDDYDLARAEEQNLNALLTGMITQYRSDASVESIEYCKEEEKWSVRKDYAVTINTAFRLIDVATGNILYSRRISDTQKDSTTYTPPGDSRGDVLQSVRIFLNDHTQHLKEQAMENIIQELFRDISPHHVRKRVPREDD